MSTVSQRRSRPRNLFGQVHRAEHGLTVRYRLLSPKHPLLQTLAAQFPFETAIGMNGRIWVKAGSVGETIALKRVIEAVDKGELGTSKTELDGAVKRMLA